MNRKRPGIRTRLAASILLVLLFVFAVVWGTFNAIVGRYIESRALAQLGEARAHVNRDVFAPREPPTEARMEPPAEFSGTMERITGAAGRAHFVTQVQAMVVTPDYRLLFPFLDGSAAGTPRAADLDRAQAVLSALHGRNVDLADDATRRLSVDGALYYMVSMLFEPGPGARPGEAGAPEAQPVRLVLFTDMTDVAALSGAINRMLLVIIAVTALVSGALILLMSARIARPIRALSLFAEAMGRNDFTPRDFPVFDRELVELLAAMNRAAAQLDTYDKEQKTFFQNVSHELRTPLMSIKGYAEGIAVGVFEDNAQAAEVINQEADHLTDLVEDLLYISRAENITPEYDRAVCDLREILSNCAQSLRGIALREGKRIVFDFAEEAVPVACEEQNLSRAFTNILSNGLRYCGEAVTLRCKREGGKALAAVEDDGPGIAEADMPKLFDRFYKGRGGKHGIGLAIAKAVIRRHHGEVTARNLERGGAAFDVTLPAAE